MQKEKDNLSRVDRQPLADHGDLPRPATGPFGATLPEKIRAIIADFGYLTDDDKVAIADAIDAALRQVREADAVEYQAKLDRVIELERRAYDGLNLCPDHRDKSEQGRCIVCDGERRGKHEARETDVLRVEALEEALGLILTDPYGCPMCDSGKLRDLKKQHWDRCGFAKAEAVALLRDRIERTR